MRRTVTLFCVAALLVLSVALPTAAAPKNPKTTFASECAALGGTVNDAGTSKPHDDTCTVVENYRTYNDQGYWVYHQQTTVYDTDFAVIDEQHEFTGCNFVDRPMAEPTVPPAPVDQCPPNILI